MRNGLWVPTDEFIKRLDWRRIREDPPAFRSEAQRDRDRVIYSSAFLRLGRITQVAAPETGHIFHSRLTHSLKVAQVARRLAEVMIVRAEAGELGPGATKVVSALDPDAVEAVALAHDLGHPPFGHLAEEELQRLAKDFGSFEGNAQSFRIVTALAVRSTDLQVPGLNLTRRTLNGLLKYPWLREADHEKHGRKWGAYDVDGDYFTWVREGHPDRRRTLEAEIMDWADDVTYAVHDMDDFYRAGLVPLERLAEAREELRVFEDYLRRKDPQDASRLIDAAERLFGLITISTRYRGRAAERADLRKLGSWLITRYLSTVTLVDAEDGETAFFEIGEPQRAEVDMLKRLIWFYIIDRPSLATIQQGQRQVIRHLFNMYADAWSAGEPNLSVFPPAIAERIGQANTDVDSARAVIDLIAGMTEDSAQEVYKRAIGVSHGSLLTDAGGPS